MFDTLISRKIRVKVYCGKDFENKYIIGIITKHYDNFGLIQIGNILLPIEWIAKIEVLADEQENERKH